MKWINLLDEMPKNGVRVLISSNYGVTVGCYNNWSRLIQDFVSGNDEGMTDLNGVEFKPTHWMPLPEPPEDE